MTIVYDEESLRTYFRKDWMKNYVGDILLDRFLEDAIEVDVDAVRDAKGECWVAGVMQHIEKAGVHSGDSACCLPPHSLPPKVVTEIRRQAEVLAEKLNVVGLMNVQFAVSGDDIYVLEANPRASRTVPFVSKATGFAAAKVAARVMAGESLAEQECSPPGAPPYFAVKEAVFPFNKFPDVDVLLGPEMKSTGETMGIADDFARAFMLAQEAIQPLPREGAVFVSVPDEDKPAALEVARGFAELGYSILATSGTANYLNAGGVTAAAVNKVKEGRPHIVDAIVSGEVQMVVNTETGESSARRDSFSIRRAALSNKVIYFTTVAGAEAAVRGLQSGLASPPRALQEWRRVGT